MTVLVDWDQSPNVSARSVIYWIFEETWDWYDFGKADRQAYQMALSVPHRVDSIVDFRRSQRIPRSGALSYFSGSVTKAPPNRGIVVVVQPPAMVRALESVLRRLYPASSAQYVLASTLDEAYALIAQHRQQHPAGYS
jgi:hypothetical protein